MADRPFQPDHPISNERLEVPESRGLLPPDNGPRQDFFDANPFRGQAEKKLMRRPGFGKDGKAIQLRLNSHAISNAPNAKYYQYAVSCSFENLPSLCSNRLLGPNRQT